MRESKVTALNVIMPKMPYHRGEYHHEYTHATYISYIDMVN